MNTDSPTRNPTINFKPYTASDLMPATETTIDDRNCVMVLQRFALSIVLALAASATIQAQEGNSLERDAQKRNAPESNPLIKQISINDTRKKLTIDVDDAFSKSIRSVLKTEKHAVEMKEILQVRMAGKGTPNILGKVRFEPAKGKLLFEPRIPLSSGITLVIEVNWQGKRSSRRFSIPETPTQKTRLTKMYPAQEIIPENTLKLYLHFSSPMKRGDIYQHFSIVNDTTGKQIDLPFLELEQELWSRDRKRLTLLFDPGRIKRELKPRLEMGPVFQSGQTYRFVVSGKWKDENGNALGDNVVKKYRIKKADKLSPDPANWKLKVPAINSREPLHIKFDEPLDSALALRVIEVSPFKQEGLSVAKKLLNDKATRISIVPKDPWTAGLYQISIGKSLEDLCGNRIDRPFDLDLNQKPNVSRPTFELQFLVKPKKSQE